MRIILTHEQADFDAIASLLGAHLVDEGSIPVLPRRMNRNVRAFLNLYGVELPFVDPRDLPSDTITTVTLVDTQSIISVKGMGPGTKVRVIDHHPVRDDLPKDWKVTTDETGATTTIFVEFLRDRNGAIETIPATLLLLGIYEDTGSLTYTRTTPRDLNAAAFLLERGASLDIASDFLNHPLSPQQQSLYDQLQEAAQIHTIHGQTIVVASGDAQDIEEELSTVAHKMRDLLAPNALFLLIQTKGGVQLIARSTSDNIDVAEITAYFGGGGHERAAASLIKDGELEQVEKELLEILPRFIQPGITVSHIMSRGPQLLTPDTPVDQAANRMRRFGYEGYPVVDAEGQVVGLLTRRAVDRALSHKLKMTAASLMEAGNFTVLPDDSVDHLQRLMSETGWGQIPVVQPESGRIIGIVTRTDLLKTLNRDQRATGTKNLANRLETALPPARLALLKAIAAMAHQEKCALYIVGGFVRDLLLARPSLDFDLVVEGDAIVLAGALSRKYGGRVTTHARFGTAKWHIVDIRQTLLENLIEDVVKQRASGVSWASQQDLKPDDLPETIDLITARTEFYTYPSALPTVERGSIKLDLHRRDFTINTLALRLDGRYYGDLQDYWGGLNDLNQGMVRVLHSLSFVDDPTRILRAVRFEQRFGFEIERRTLQLLHEARPLLERLSGDRIRHELDHILVEEQVCAMIARLQELNLLTAIYEDLTWDEWLCGKILEIRQREPETYWGIKDQESLADDKTELNRRLAYLLWCMRMSARSARELINQLKIPRSLADEILAACRLWRDLPSLLNATPSQVVARLEDVPALAIYTTYIACDDERLQHLLQIFASQWQFVKPTIDGHQLRMHGLPPGPVYRHLLARLRNAWLDGDISSAEEEKELLERLLSEEGIQAKR
jgi:tRNA nucleotidyltransferase (CCA-adding enzyme)